MKKYKPALDVILLVSMAIVSALAVAPNELVMPTSIQMLILTVLIGLLAAFLVLLWRENPSDEREADNQAIASRTAYVVGAIVLIVALLGQSLNHKVDPVIPIALLAMIATKIILQRQKDER